VVSVNGDWNGNKPLKESDRKRNRESKTNKLKQLGMSENLEK